MDWTALAWRPFEGRLVEALAPHAEILRSALEEAASAVVSAPVTIRSLDVVGQGAEGAALDAALPGWLDPAAFVPFATFELLGGTRRSTWIAIDPSEGGVLAGSEIEAQSLAATLITSVEEAFAAILGDGLGLGGPESAVPMPASGLVAVRLVLAGTDERPVALVAAVETAALDELVAHVEALVALQAPPAAQAVAPAPAPAPAAAPAAATAPAPAPSPATAPAPAPAPAAAIPAAPPAGLAPAVPVAATSGNGHAADAPQVRPVAFDELAPRQVAPAAGNIDLLLGVNLQVTVEIGRTKLPIRDILALAPGSIVELDKLAGEQVDVLVNGHPIAQGEVVVVDENFGVRIMTIVPHRGRISSAGAA